MPSDSTYEIGMLANADAYVSDTLDGSGHLKVTVSPSCLKVDYIRAYLPADTTGGLHHNRETAFTYTIGNCPSSEIIDQAENLFVDVYPNPASNRINISVPDEGSIDRISLINTLGQVILQSRSNQIDISGCNNGIYILNIKTEMLEVNKKVIIMR
jgi:hypothetical protein